MDKISPFNLKKFRQETGMSQKQFAEAVDLPTRTYRSYEAGERGLSIEKFRDLKAKLGFHREHEKQSLRARIDYLRISFPALRDLESFCENFLFCHLSEFSAQETLIFGNEAISGFLISLIKQKPKTTNPVFNYQDKGAVSWKYS